MLLRFEPGTFSTGHSASTTMPRRQLKNDTNSVVNKSNMKSEAGRYMHCLLSVYVIPTVGNCSSFYMPLENFAYRLPQECL